jgi:hypothetical protein
MLSLQGEDDMRALTRIGILMGLGLFAVGITSVFAFDCPNTYKAVMAYYDKTAKVSGVDQAKLTQAKNMLDDAMKKHEGGSDRGSMDGTAQVMMLITQSRP